MKSSRKVSNHQGRQLIKGSVAKTNNRELQKTVPPIFTLKSLAKEANKEHELATKAASTAVRHGMRCGELLREAKDKLKTESGHGHFLPWLQINFAGSQRTAQVYMWLAANTQRAADFDSIRAALAASEKPIEEEIIVAELVEEPVKQLTDESTNDAQPVVSSPKPKPTTKVRYSAYRYLGAACEAAKEQGISAEELIDALKEMLSQYDLIQTTTHND